MRILFLFSLLPTVFSEFGINKKCVTPHGDIGTCKELTSCHIFRTYASSLNNTSVKKYLKQSYCGKRYNMILICCGPENRDVFEECGSMENVRQRIYGGEVSSTHFPWMAAIQYKKDNVSLDFKCQGFLINPHFVLTAAHCLKSQKVASVVLGVSNLTNYHLQQSHKRARILNITYHEDFVQYIDDIGIIQIMPVKYTENVRWICLPSKNTLPPDWYTIRGWGRNDKMVQTFSVALQSRVRSAPYSGCRHANSRNIPQNRVICAGGEPNKDSCEGDSGGALMNNTSDYDWTAFGIVSFGSKDCSRGDPGVYTRIQYYLEWLDKKMIEMLEHSRTK